MFYAESRKHFLSSLSEKYSTKIRIPTADLKRNVKVNYYLDKYEVVQKSLKAEENKRKSYLRAD